ncbi:MAG TPA: prolyl oligopeptidase family serine peptidase, partial [bacterium]|nr:prolyl oligopeptidase family serine peptidase [bacterium]
YLWEDAGHLPEIAVNREGRQTLLTNNSRQLEEYQTGSAQLYRWESVDGAEIEGVLFLPPGFEESSKYPMILTVHGGPYGRFRREFLQYYFSQQYTADGYIVFAPNPRGSSGYTDAFGKAIWHEKGGHMGGIDYQDIMAGVDALIRDGYVDSTRMGVTGGSYGGYLTNWIISRTDRFAAAVSMYGIFSLFTDWSNSWQPAWEKMYLGIYYWEQPINREHPYVQYSPAFYVENIRTPVLIMHGTDDKYTNLSNSQEMHQALKTLGREVKFVVYPREGHGLSDEPNHRRDVLLRAKRWFDQYLQ